MVTTKLRIAQLRKEVGFFVVPVLSRITILGSSFITFYIKEISPKTGLITPSDSSSVAIIVEIECDFMVSVSVKNFREENEKATNERLCVSVKVEKLPSTSKTMVAAMNSCGGI